MAEEGKIKKVKKRSMRTSNEIIIVHELTTAFMAILFYPLIPILMNYPPSSINTKFDKEFSAIYYIYQYAIAVVAILFIGYLFLKIMLKGMDDWKTGLGDAYNNNKLLIVRKKCLNVPYIIYFIQILVPFFVIVIILLLLGFYQISDLKLVLLVFTFGTLAAEISYILTKKKYINILFETYHYDNNNKKNEGLRIGLKNRVILQFLPMILSTILFTFLMGYSRLVYEKGDILFEVYKGELENRITIEEPISSIHDLEAKISSIDLKSPRDRIFIISPNKDIKISGEPLSDFFLKYLYEISPQYGGHVYDYYGVDVQGAVRTLKGQDGEWMIGVIYEVASGKAINLFGINFFILILLNAFVLYFFAKALSDDVSLVAKSLDEIAESNDVNFNSTLTVTSNDEIGDLVVAFNKIQQKELENINSIKENQAILLEQERLASLGQLIGGIAHNLKTPIMSISGGIEAVKDLVYEYRDSIDDKSVTEQDHKEIARDMLAWLDKMKPYCAYMSDVISAVKGQAVQMNASTTEKFTVDELVKRVDLLMKHELKKNHCILKLDSQIDMRTEVKGEVNNLVQVFDNIIINAVHAYEGKTGTIDLKIVRSGDNVEFIFRDYGKGIPGEITDRLFKEMVTTKGRNGTGLGLYMSYSTVRGRFGGNISFTSKVGVGTTFYISIPCITYNQKEVS